MGNGEEEASRDCERGIEATRRDGRRGQSRRTRREDGRLGCGPGPGMRLSSSQHPVLGPGPSSEETDVIPSLFLSHIKTNYFVSQKSKLFCSFKLKNICQSVRMIMNLMVEPCIQDPSAARAFYCILNPTTKCDILIWF
jgi:hypothetical protein